MSETERAWRDRKAPYDAEIQGMADEVDDFDVHSDRCATMSENDPDACDCSLRYWLERAFAAGRASIPAEPEQADDVAGLDVSDVFRMSGYRCPLCGEPHIPPLAHSSADLEAWRLFARLAPARDDTSAWLVERGQGFGYSPPVYWTGDGFSPDPFKAKRFTSWGHAANEIQQQRCRHEFHIGMSCVPLGHAVEHRFIARLAPARDDTHGGAS